MYATEKENTLSKDYHDCDLANADCHAWFSYLRGCCFIRYHVNNLKRLESSIPASYYFPSQLFILADRLVVCTPRAASIH